MRVWSRRCSWTVKPTTKNSTFLWQEEHDIQHDIQFVTVPRKGADKSPRRQEMMRQRLTRQNRKDYKQRSITVEPMQGLVKDIFDLDRCWMPGDAANRWLFAAMGLAVQIAQRKALRQKRSTWNIKHEVLGL